MAEPLVTRRDFLKLSLVAVATALFGCKSFRGGDPTSTPMRADTPTSEPIHKKTPEAIRTAIPERTKTSIPEQPKLLEKIETGIPSLSVERYQAKFQDITNEVPDSYRKNLGQWVRQPEFSPEEGVKRWVGQTNELYGDIFPKQSGLSFIGIDTIRPNHRGEFFYFNGDGNRFYTNIMDYDRNRCGCIMGEGEEERILNWKTKTYGLTTTAGEVKEGFTTSLRVASEALTDISRNGKILYRVSGSERLVTIIADIPNGTKTLIKDSELRSITSKLSDDGNSLVLSFPDDTDSPRGTYLVDLNSWHIRFHTKESAYITHCNEDGSLLYLLFPVAKENLEQYGLGRIGHIHNTVTGEMKEVKWPTFFTLYDSDTSPNLNFMARTAGIFPSFTTVEGQWGIMAYTPEGFFIISAPEKSLSTRVIDNNGTIYTWQGDVFEFRDGTYKLVKTGDGKPIDVKVEAVK